jgi:hypothetical protein
VPDLALIEIAERVLAQRLGTSYALASAACPNDEQQKGADLLWLHIGMSYGQFRSLATAIARAYEEGLTLAAESGGHAE